MRLVEDCRGVAYTEFLIAFLPFFVLVLGITQLALLGAAHLAVRHAANAAVRSAVVLIDDDPARYEGEPRRVLDPNGRGSSSSSSILGISLPARRGDGRTRDIRMAAYVPLIGIAPSWNQIISSDQRLSIGRALGTSSLTRAGTGALYVLGATGVIIGQRGRTTRFAEGDDVTVRVTHAYPCLVPLASRVLCDNWIELQSGLPITMSRELAERVRAGVSTPEDIRAVLAAQSRVRDQSDRLEAASDPLEDLEHAELSGLLWATVATGTRFRVLTSESTLPLHSAPYPYQSEVRR